SMKIAEMSTGVLPVLVTAGFSLLSQSPCGEITVGSKQMPLPDNCPTPPMAAVPVTAQSSAARGALLSMWIVPLNVPAASGWKSTWNGMHAPAGMLSGLNGVGEGSRIENAGDEPNVKATPVTFRVHAPVLQIWICATALAGKASVPKSTGQ